VLVVPADISQEYSDSIFREDRSSRILQNINIYLPNYTVSIQENGNPDFHRHEDLSSHILILIRRDRQLTVRWLFLLGPSTNFDKPKSTK
jgi:hypothetical protein